MNAHLNLANTRRHPVIGVLASWQVYAGTLNTLLSPILRGLFEAAQAQECHLLLACGVVSDFSTQIHTAWPLLAPEVDFLPVGSWNTDGLVVIAPLQAEAAQKDYLRELQAAGHPLVFIETSELGPAVCLDNAGGIREALHHLQSHGHRQIAFIGGGAGWAGDGQERLQAFQEGCLEMGLATDPRLMAYGQFTNPGGQAAMREILASGVPFSAVLAANDESAVGAMQVLREAGRRIPENVAVIGFDNRFEARNQSPPLTTVHQPAYEIGWQALELMLRTLAGEAGPATVQRVPTQLVIRESCGCKPAAPSSAAATAPLSQAEWSAAVARAVFAQVGQLHLEQVRTLASNLVDGLTRSLEAGSPEAFQAALNAILDQVATLDEDTHAWQVALYVLRQYVMERGGTQSNQGLGWLDEARMTVSESAQRQLLRYLTRQNEITRQLSLMTAELSETMDQSALQTILDRYVPGLGIRHAHLILFEPEPNDPVAWSFLPGSGETPWRFSTRSFPPPGLYPESPPYQLALLPILLQKQTAGFVAFDAANLYPCLAVTRQLTSTLENIRLYHEAAHGRQLAEEANRLKSRFLSTVSHELRTPLNLITGWSELLVNQSQADAPQIARQIHTSAQHLGRLIRDVLDLASSDAGQLRLTCEPLALDEAFQMVSETCKQLATEKGLEWKTDLASPLPLVWGDRTRLQQITLNLVSNAVKFTTQGWVKLQIRADANWVEVAVQDTGLGIPPAEQAWIFDEFRQSERTAARGYGGLGLGLAICKRLVELHNGEIGVRSNGEEGAGSTFYFRLPVFESVQPTPAAQPQTVLLLTRQPETSQPLLARLQRAGFTVEQQSVEAIPDWLSRLLVAPPGAVILDEPLAVEYGWELLKVFRGSPQTANIPVLFYALDGEKKLGSVLALDYLMKPVNAGELVQALARQEWPKSEQDEKVILVVDDDPGLLEMNARLVQEQYPRQRVLKARDGRAALEILSQNRVHLVLLDLMMPEVDGFGVLEQMRAWESTRETAVIVLTSKTLTADDMARLKQGVAQVMSKGLYDGQEMLTQIENVLAQHPRLGSEAQRLARKAMIYIHENYAQPLTREDLARYVNTSNGHLARCFRQETGLTPMTYLNRYRLQQAKTLLTTTQDSITAIALACGFSESNYFSRSFHQETGQSPLAYRREHQR